MAKKCDKKRRKKIKWLMVFSGGFVFAIICFVLLNIVMEQVSSSEYCGGTCHEMNVSYQSWELSSHGSNEIGIRVKCIDCHLPSNDDYFTHLAAKAYAGGKDLYMHHFGPAYDREKMRQDVLDHMPNERCQTCHNDLLAKPTFEAARIAHLAVRDNPDNPENKCVKCHEYVGHEPHNTLFQPISRKDLP